MLSIRCYPVASLFASLFLSLNAMAQAPGSTPSADFFVHHKHASINQGEEHHFGTTVAMHEDVLVAADDLENVEVLRRNGDGTWSFEALIAPPASGIDFGARHAIATNGEWIAIGAAGDDTFGTNAGAVHLYQFDGADWQYEGALSHMAPYGSIGYDGFGKAVAMEDGRMVVGSNAENSEGGKGAIHYFEYNGWLNMWLETGFIASEGTANGNVTRFASSLDISGDWMIVGEYGDDTEGALAGAAYIYHWVNQCWHLNMTFYGHEPGDRLGTDVSISGLRAVAGSPQAGLDGLSQSGAVTLYEYTEFSGPEYFWTETFHFIPQAVQSWDRFGTAVDLDGDLLAVGAPTDDNNGSNAGLGYFLFDCSTASLECVAEGSACDAEPNDRFGYDVAVSGGLAAIGAERDDNIFDEAGSVYVLGSDDLGFACDLTAPAAPMVDLVDENDSGADNEDNLTRHTTPDFDVFLPGGGTMALMNGVSAQAGDALIWTLDGTTESEMVFLTQDDIDNGYVTMQFVYPGPVLPDGVYTFCAQIIDVFGNEGATDCLTVTIDNEDPEPNFAGGAEYNTSNTDDYGAFLPGAMTPEECEGLAATAGGTWDGTFTDAATLMVSPGCYNVGANTYEWQTYATFLPDTTLYLDAMGNVMLDLSSADNLSATDNIAIDTVYADLTDFDCDDAGMTLPVTVTAVDMAGNLGTITVQVEILDEVAPEALTQDLTVQLDATGAGTITAEDIDNGSNDACGIQSLALDVTFFDCASVGANTVTLTVTDNNGNVSTATATVTVEDNVAPTVVTQDITVQLDAAGAASITTADIDNGSSDACGVQTMALDITSFSCANVGANTVTLTVTDNNGNSASATATVTVEDNVAPTAIAQNLTVELDASGAASITAAQVDNGSSDACGIASLSLSQTAFDCDDQGANTVTLTVTDNNGNQSTATATITVVDLVDPTAATQDITVQLDATGNASITAAQVDNGSDDTCGGIASMTVSPDSFDCDDLGDNTVTLTVFDGSGNSATATATVTVVDEIAPDVTATFPADIVIYADDITGDFDPTPLGAGAASVDYSDNCSGSGSQTYGVAGQVPTGGLIITAIGDPNDAASTCRFVEIHNSGDGDIDLTGYALQRWTNGNAGPSTSTNIDLSSIGTLSPGQYAWIANNAGFEGCYGFAPSIIAGSGGPADSNGDDQIAIIDGASNLIDMFGVAGEDGSNTCHEFEDGIALRAGSNTDPNGGAWDESGWIVYSDGSSASGCTNHNANQPQDASDIALLINNWAGAGPAAPETDFNSVDISYADVTTSYTATACYTFERTWTITVTDASGNATTVTDVQTVQVADTSAPDIAALENTTAAWDLFSFDLSAGDQSTVLAYTSFEEGSTGDQYVDTGDASVDHALANNPGQSVVNFTSTGGEMGFSSYYYSTGSNGLTDGDFVGVTSFTGAVGAFTDGSQGFQMQDTDGIMEVVFDNVDVSMGGVTLTLDYFPQSTGWETGDRIRIWVVADGGEIDLVDTDYQDIDNLSIEGQWNEATLDLDGFDDVELHISLESNSGSEGLFIDNIAFSAGNSPLAALEANGYVSFSDNVELASTEAAITLDGNTCDGAYDIVYTATDSCGNSTTASQRIDLLDTVDPTISGMPADITQTNDAGNCSASVSWAEPTADDNCSVATLTSDHDSGDTFPVGTTTVIYTATDPSGNESTSSFTVTVTDDEDPTISGTPANISQDSDPGSCTATVTWTAPTAADNCALASLTSTHDSGDSFFIGTTTVTYTATDIHGNISTSSFTVTINEVEAPVISGMPADITQTADAGLCSAAVTWTEPTASDNCNVASFTSTHNSGDAFAVGTTTVTYTAVDNAGNSTTASFNVTVTDNEAPSTSGTPADITQTNDAGNCSAAVSFTAPNAADNCAIDTFTSSHDSGDTFPVGSTTVTFTATDIHGNTTTSTFTVTVTDDEDPAISGMPADISQTNDAGNCSAAVTWTEPTAADNCAIATFTSSHSPGATFPVGATTVTYTATDIHGNNSSSSFTVTVTDDEAPAIAGMPADMTLSNDAGDCSAIATWTAPTSSDNCGVTSFTSTHDSGDSFAVGATTVTYTAMDAAGNTTTASFTVTVTDDENPAISGMPADISKTNDAGNCSAVASWTEPTAADNCAIATFTSTHSPGDAFVVGPTTVTYTATDIHGNSSTASFTITVTDDEDPSISGMPADITQTADAGLCSAVVTWADPSAADNCAVDTFTSSHSSGDAFGVGTTTVTYTATDIHGNTTTSTFDVTVTDDEDPAISGMPADISQTNDAGECMAAVTWTEPTAADNCAIATFTSSHDPGDEFPVGTTTVTYTATDIHGNTSSDSFDIEVTDDEAPTISGMPADISQSNDAGVCAADVSWAAPTAGDNCAVASFTSTHDSGDTFAVGTTTVTYSVTDIHGNSTSSSFTVTVTDDENPAISPMAADETYQRDGGEAAAFAAWLASYGGAAATDNCGIDSWSDNSTGLSDDCGSTGTETVTFTVTDIHGNSSATTATFTVIDDHAPSCPLIDLTDGSDTGLSNSDNITNDDTPIVHVVFTGSGVESAEAGDIVELYIGGSLSQTHTVTQTDVDNGYAAFETGPLADGPVGFSALHIDDCGQSSIFAFLNIIVHSTNPSAAGADMTIELDADGNASIEDEDVDDGSEDDFNVIDLMASQTDFDCSDVGDNTVTLTVTDIAGNTSTTTVTVTVVDDIAPTVELVPMPGSQDPVEVTFTFTTDAYGAAEASATIYDSEGAVVEDYPLGSFPNSGLTDETVDLDPGTYTIVLGDDWGDGWSWAPATGEDAVVISGGATGSLDFLDGTSASLEFTVAGDGTAPGGITVELGADGTVSVAAEDLVMSATDNCGIAGMALDITSFDCDDLGDNAVVVTVTDVNGNTTTANATVTVEDNLGPVVEVETGSGTAGPVDVTFTFTTDPYGAAEAFATLYDSDGATVADYPLGSFSNSAVSEETVSLDPGTYTIVLGDDWGDGWSWAPATGLDVLVLSGGASGSLDFVDGNSASLEFTVEGEAPTGPGGITVELGPDGTVSIEPGDVLVSATDNCGVDGMSLDISDFDCDDLGNNAVVLTVTDVNGNSTSETAYVTVEDNEAPVVNIFDLEAYTLYAGETCVNEVDLFAAGQPWYEATDNCGADVEIVYDVINETGVAGCREFDRRWIIHAVDASGNTDSDTTLQHITVLDDTAPMVFFDNVPEDLTIELGADCTADIPAAGTPLDSVAVTFTYTIDQWAAEAQMTILDSEGEVVEFIDLVTDGSSTYPYDLYYTNGTDNTGGFTLIQTLNLAPGDYSFLLYDDWGDGWVWSAVDGTDALVLSGGASGSWDFSSGNEVTGTFTVEEAVAFDMTASATDNCTAMPELGDITYVDSAPQALCEDAGSYTITRTFMATATDECGNETVGEYIQTLTFLDVTAPQITDSEGIDNGETISETDADDIFAFISVPSPIDLDAADACGGDVTIVETESFSGFVPTDDIGNYCGAATPAAFLDGEACDGSAPAAIVLEGAYFGGEAFTIADGGINIVESYFDQTLHIEVEVTNADGTGGFIWSADYNEAYSWAEWSGLGRGYKKDCGNVLPGTSPWTGWDYFVMQTGGMIGTGIYAGSELSLTHQPMNYYYGLQVGQGANNQNAKYGASAWFYWSGELVVNGASQGSVASSGDIMLDLDCTMPWSAEYAYTVSDACGNTTTFSYTVEGDESNAGGAYVSGEESGHQPFDISVIGDLKDPIRVTGLMPNPTNDVSQLGFVVSQNMRLRVDLYNMAGELVQELYDGNAMTDVEYLMNVDANGLDAGMYQIRISSSTYMAVKKLLVTQ